MTVSASVMGKRLRSELDRLDNGRLPVAELCRRVGRVAEQLGVPRPSYEQVRVVVHELRRRKAVPSGAEVAVDIAFRVRPPEAIVDHLAGTTTRLRR